MNGLFKFQKENNPSDISISSLFSQNQFQLLTQVIEDRYKTQKQVIEDRSQLIIDNLINTKEFFLDSLPKDILNMNVQRFFEEYDGNLENILKEEVKIMNIVDKNKINREVFTQKDQNKVTLEKVLCEIPEFNESERRTNSEENDNIIEMKINETPSQKIIKSPIFSKKKVEFSEKKTEFSEKNDSNKSNLLFEKSLKKRWVP